MLLVVIAVAFVVVIVAASVVVFVFGLIIDVVEIPENLRNLFFLYVTQ